MTDKATFEVTITSPHGKRAIENWRHWIGKVADEAEERWGIEIDVTRVDESPEAEPEFQKASEQ
jgi:hypothetical protein